MLKLEDGVGERLKEEMSLASSWLDSSSSNVVSSNNGNDITDPWSSSQQQLRARKSSPSPQPPIASTSSALDPWSLNSDTDYLHPSTSQQQLRARKSSPSFPTSASTSQVVDRHPLRSPSPRQGPSENARPLRPGTVPRRPSAVASEWKAIGAGLAGLFGGGSSGDGYRWPADPSPSIRAGYSDEVEDDERRKGKAVNSVEGVVDRLEGWFGLRQQPSTSSGQPSYSTSSPPSHRSRPTSTSTSQSHLSRPTSTLTSTSQTGRSRPTASDSSDTVRVLIHPVSPTDTLPSLALHYGADPALLRKSNKLWPGDPVQIRKVIYIPVDGCKHRPPNAEIKVMKVGEGLVFVPKSEEEDLLTGTPTKEIKEPEMRMERDPVIDFLGDTNKFYTNTDTSLTRSGSINGLTSLTPSLRNLGSTTKEKRKKGSSIAGSSAVGSVSAASSGFVPPRQPLPVSKVSADQLRFFGGEKGKASRKDAGSSGIDDLLSLSSHPKSRPDLNRYPSTSNEDDSEDEDGWKPNTWHFGSSSSHTKELERSSGGWNDAPHPNALVAKAYDGGKAHARRQAQQSHRLLYDLAAGLPPNTGAAKKWSKPIAFNDLPGTPSGSGVGKSKGAGGGLGRLIDDTIRGRISVEAALEGVVERVGGKTSASPSTLHPQTQRGRLPPPPRSSTASRMAAAPPGGSGNGREGERGVVEGVLIDPLGSTSTHIPSKGLEQRRKVDWTQSAGKGKDD